MGELVHIRLDTKLRTKIKKAVKNSFHSSETDFIRNAIRKELETQEKIEGLIKLWSSIKEKKNNKPIPISEVFRAVGLE